ncbi:uncharacterized protein K02A2.6-like [Leucoraja erinacea]|uniref:uncharacterized protein K02A2.6-like n=1 Tax=Leucoraja erinaceus TaxID=7782 RepID=UPI002456020E|nr:uncharacterized protein K02A2.6-like [Leucoraja erinacea]
MAVDFTHPSHLDTLVVRTADDATLQMLTSVINHGWSGKQYSLPLAVQPYFSVRDEVAIEGGVNNKGHKAVILASLQQKYFDTVHGGHPGSEAAIQRAKSMFFWPAMSDYIRNRVQSCAVCNSMAPHQQKEPLLQHPVPVLPWSMVATDIFDWRGNQYLVQVDSYSEWFEIDLLPTASAAAVVKKRARHLPVHGASQTLMSFNGGQFTSAFQGLCTLGTIISNDLQWEPPSTPQSKRHITSSPEYLQSNRPAERAVRSAKELMEASIRAESDMFLDLLNLHNIPHDPTSDTMCKVLMIQCHYIS